MISMLEVVFALPRPPVFTWQTDFSERGAAACRREGERSPGESSSHAMRGQRGSGPTAFGADRQEGKGNLVRTKRTRQKGGKR